MSTSLAFEHEELDLQPERCPNGRFWALPFR